MAKFQRINENIFKLQEADKYSTEQLQAIWQEDEHGEYIQVADDGSARYIAHGQAMEEIAPKGTGDWKYRLINQWFNKNGIFLNIWYVNERGNIELVSRSGKFLGGLVENTNSSPDKSKTPDTSNDSDFVKKRTAALMANGWGLVGARTVALQQEQDLYNRRLQSVGPL